MAHKIIRRVFKLSQKEGMKGTEARNKGSKKRTRKGDGRETRNNKET